MNRIQSRNAAFSPKNILAAFMLAETITHSAFYTGWPNAVNAALIAKEVFKEH